MLPSNDRSWPVLSVARVVTLPLRLQLRHQARDASCYGLLADAAILRANIHSASVMF